MTHEEEEKTFEALNWDDANIPPPPDDFPDLARQPNSPVATPAWPSCPAIAPNYWQTPVQALPTTGVGYPRYFQALIRIHSSITGQIFGEPGANLECALTGMDSKPIHYIAYGVKDNQRKWHEINQLAGIHPVTMLLEQFASPGQAHYQLPIRVFNCFENLRFFVEVQKIGDHAQRKVARHPLIWAKPYPTAPKSDRLIFDYGTSFP